MQGLVASNYMLVSHLLVGRDGLQDFGEIFHVE